MLRCRDVDGSSYLLSDIALSCEDAEYASHKAYAIFGVLVFPIGVAAFFTALVGHNRKKLPPDWWPARAPEEAARAYQKYRSKRTQPKKFEMWKPEHWDPRMARYDKLHKRVGFLFFAYNKGYWWFEPVLLLYKLSMTVLILFVSDGDANKILFGMLGATAMMATLAFFQPFKHPDILSINTGAQTVVLLVLFAAMFLLENSGGGSDVIAVMLVLFTLAPLAASVVITLRLPQEARVIEAGDAISGSLSKTFTDSFQKWFTKKRSKAPAAVRGTTAFGAENPMCATKDRNNAGAVGMQSNPGSAAGRESDLVAASERPSPSSAHTSSEEGKCVL
jgi:hypothetical protein